jgi:hypothetical protein
MFLTPEIIAKVVWGCWFAMGGGLIGAIYLGAFGGFLSDRKEDPPRYTGRALVTMFLFLGFFIAASLVGTSACLVGLLQLKKSVCPMLSKGKSNFGYYLFFICTVVFLWVYIASLRVCLKDGRFKHGRN